MEEQKKIYKLPSVPHDAIITIETSGAFLKRCQSLLIFMGEQIGKDKLKDLLEKFKDPTKGPADPNEEIIFILIALVSEIEKKAIEQDKVKEVEVTPEMMEKIMKSS